MDEQTIREQLLKLIEEIKQLPEATRKDLETVLTSDILKKHEELQKSVTFLQDTLSSLRLNVKYLLFDLEITRKENMALKKRLEEHGL
ncbi:MAG: hypothetical protein MRJ65_14445 [Candidatus Brocadiaceae bacterium]|nr:hypothetical protein [Candidatus Brocadiaceae bacterium]